MTDVTVNRAADTTHTKLEVNERPPPRPSDMPSTPSKGTNDVRTGRADVQITTDEKERVHVEVETHEEPQHGAAAGGLPRNPEEWRRLLSKAAPWLAAAAIVVAAGALGSNRDEVGSKARHAKHRAAAAAEDADEGAKRTWFGLKHRSEHAADKAEGKLDEAKHAAKHKAHEAKHGAKEAAHDAKHNLRSAADSTKHAAEKAADRVSDAAADAKHAAKHGAESAKHGARHAAHSVKEGAEAVAEGAKEKADEGFFMWKKVTAGVKDNYNKGKHAAEHAAHEVAHGAKHAVHDVASGARHGAQAVGHAADNAKHFVGHKAEEAADAIYHGAAKGVAGAGAAEEQTGKNMKEAGKRLEKAGKDTKTYYGGEADQPKRRKFLGLF